ncbi:MAG: ETC complex I subunit [Caulobacteraceae bacterium]
MLARIYRPAKSAMQSGRANTASWVLDFAPASARYPDPLMGWTQSADPRGQVRLLFDSRETAVAYAQKHGIAFELLQEEGNTKQTKSYADNFAFRRRVPWTH